MPITMILIFLLFEVTVQKMLLLLKISIGLQATLYNWTLNLAIRDRWTVSFYWRCKS